MGKRPGPPDGARPPAPAATRPDEGADRFKQLDRNGDGKLQKDELPGPMQAMFEKADTNSDGAVTRAELKKVVEAMRGGPR
jgi:Ca2+-binding EF-hand superfamily protein